MLGELYQPRGLALETARAVLETEQVYACNVAWGCSNFCRYCYVPRFTHRRKYDCEVRLPKKPPFELVRHQLERHWRFHWKSQLGVFLSFLTDPFLPQVKKSTAYLIDLLQANHIRVATLSKLDNPYQHGVRKGMTIVSLDEGFWRNWEPNTPPPYKRILTLKFWKEEFDEYVWISMEPYPPSTIYKQNFMALLEELKFADLIVFGRWNYDKRARTEQARRDYAKNVRVLTDFCKSNNIRLHVKSDTLKFVGVN